MRRYSLGSGRFFSNEVPKGEARGPRQGLLRESWKANGKADPEIGTRWRVHNDFPAMDVGAGFVGSKTAGTCREGDRELERGIASLGSSSLEAAIAVALAPCSLVGRV